MDDETRELLTAHCAVLRWRGSSTIAAAVRAEALAIMDRGRDGALPGTAILQSLDPTLIRRYMERSSQLTLELLRSTSPTRIFEDAPARSPDVIALYEVLRDLYRTAGRLDGRRATPPSARASPRYSSAG